MEKPDILRLDTPERTSPPLDTFLNDPKEVERWISGLPMANISETSRQIFKTLVDLNRIDIPPLARVKTTELFRSPIGYITKNFRKFYFDTAFPLTAKNRKIAVLNRELYSELATAYKIVVHEMVTGATLDLDPKLLVIAIQRAMSCLLHVHYQSVIVYDPYPANSWKELHGLYAYAEQNHLQEISVKDEPHNTAHSSIRDIYIQSLLLAAISPYRLRQREIDKCYSQLPEWSGHARLSAPDQMTSSPTLFISRLNSNTAPVHVDLQNSSLDRHCRQLNTGGLVSLLQDKANEASEEPYSDFELSDEKSIPTQLLVKLIQVLSTSQKRRYVRTTLNFELKLAVGLVEIHRLLQRSQSSIETVQFIGRKSTEYDRVENEEIQPSDGTSTFIVENIPEIELEALTDVTTTGESTHVNDSFTDSAIMYASLWESSPHGKPSEPFSCTTDNESAGGYCISWPGPDTPKIKVGEVVGIYLSTNLRSEFRIGISRWLKNLPGQSLQVGLEIIGLTSTALYLQSRSSSNSPEQREPCLLLPARHGSGKFATLITPGFPIYSRDELILSDGNAAKVILLTRLMESSAAFSLFQFKAVGDKEYSSQEEESDSLARWFRDH